MCLSGDVTVAGGEKQNVRRVSLGVLGKDRDGLLFLLVRWAYGWVRWDRAGWSRAVRHAGAGRRYHPQINIHR